MYTERYKSIRTHSTVTEYVDIYQLTALQSLWNQAQQQRRLEKSGEQQHDGGAGGAPGGAGGGAET